MNISTTRVETLSDGVVAIIITIMVLEFKLPDISKEVTSADIQKHLIHLLPYFGVYFFSFLMIGIFWSHHHHMFHLLEKIDNVVLWQNFFFLFSLSFLPFSSGLLGANPLISASVAFYGFIMLLTTLSFSIMRTYTIKKNMVHTDEDKKLSNEIQKVSSKAKFKSYASSVSYLISIPVAFVSIYISYVCFLVPAIVFFLPEGIDDEELAEKVIEKNK